MLKRWQDLFVWLPVLLVLTYGAYRVIPAIDPRSGIDGWGDLFAGLIAAVKGVGVTVLAWLCKKLYWWEPSDATEDSWHRMLEVGYPITMPVWKRPEFALILKDRLELLAWLAFWSWVVF